CSLFLKHTRSHTVVTQSNCELFFLPTQINVLQSKRRSEILKSMLSFMYAHLTFFHQGYDLFSELQPLMKQLGGQ
ncbi:unnamed protein product, partial [Coregonus sp. 'balchen']